ncbi:MAG: response regulator [Campylobacterota bacterium]|nr:response regulator [Campylobacterota bacterium]
MKIAIIDDEKDILEMLSRFLTKKKYQVATYQNPLNALSSLDKDTDVVLLDIMMPQMNGLDVLPKLQEKHPKLKVIMMTAYSTLDKVLGSHRGGAIQYIMKPFESLAKLEVEIAKAAEK